MKKFRVDYGLEVMVLIGVRVTEANALEKLGAIVVLEEAQGKLAKIEVIWVDQGDAGANFANAVRQVCGSHVWVEMIERTSKTFERLPKRWIVERTSEWLNQFRRPSKNYELYSGTAEAMIYGSLLRLMLRRIAA
ncbi:MAG: transposase [Chloroflexaceae bacterium]|nr:transposase [Chloroflexaceae bacterium]